MNEVGPRLRGCCYRLHSLTAKASFRTALASWTGLGGSNLVTKRCEHGNQHFRGRDIEQQHNDMALEKQLFVGTFVHSKALDKLEYLHNTAVAVDQSGTIVAVERDCDELTAKTALLPRLRWAEAEVKVVHANDGQFFFPGFVGELLDSDDSGTVTDMHGQTPTSTPRSTPMPASLATRPSSTGSTPTPSRWKPPSQTQPKPAGSTRA